MTATRFAKPKPIDNLTLAFCAAGNLDELLPPMSEIPDEFKHDANYFCRLQSRWFFEGISASEFHPKPGIDLNAAIRHLSAIQGSFEPKHEHKKAGVAYLMSLWFDEPKTPKGHRPKGSNKRK